MFEIEYYSENNKNHIYEFIKEQQPKDQAKILREIDMLARFGLALGMPHIKKMEGTHDLWELRIKQSTNNFRIFYFCFKKNTFVLLHGIRKTTAKTPKRDIEIALKRLNNYVKGSD